jgi:hypothetical protein
MTLRNAFAELSIEATQIQVRDYLDQVEIKLQALRDRLDLGLALDSPTLAALENINATVSGSVSVSNMIPAVETGLAQETTLGSRASETKLEAVRALLAATLQVAGVVSLDASTLAALETIQVGNFPASQAVTGPLTDAQLRATPPAIKDDYDDREILADQSGAGVVLTFTFTQQVHMVMVTTRGTDLVCRVDPKGGAPSASFGQPIFDGATGYFPLKTSAVKVFAPSGTTVTVMGLYRA